MDGDDNSNIKTDNSSSIMATELTASPTSKTSGAVKTFAFFPEGDKEDERLLPSVTVNGDESGRPQVRLERSSEERDEGNGNFDLLGSFASGMLDKFETTLAKLGKSDSLSRSLPNVFSASIALDVDSLVADNRFSVASDTSIVSSKDEFLTDDECTSPPIHSRGIEKNDDIPVLSNWELRDGKTYDSLRSSVTTDDTPSNNYSASRRNTLDSIETESFHEIFEQHISPSAQR